MVFFLNLFSPLSPESISEAVQSKPLNQVAQVKRKKSKQSFIQDGPCYGLKLPKCRECKGNKKSNDQTNIFCRFYAFRKLVSLLMEWQICDLFNSLLYVIWWHLFVLYSSIFQLISQPIQMFLKHLLTPTLQTPIHVQKPLNCNRIFKTFWRRRRRHCPLDACNTGCQGRQRQRKRSVHKRVCWRSLWCPDR